MFNFTKACLFVPGHQPKMLQKVISLNPNSLIVPDLEDSVPLTHKEESRNTIKLFLPKLFELQKQIFPRINSFESGLLFADIDEILSSDSSRYVNGLTIPKVTTVKELLTLSSILRQKESGRRKIELIIWIESPLGLLNFKEILQNDIDRRIVGAAFGAEDFCNDFQLERTEELKELDIARNLFAMTAHAFNIFPFDTPYVEFKNREGLLKDIKHAKSLGLKGKYAIHPSQINDINNEFGASKAEIKEAMEIKTLFEIGLKNGKAAIDIDGKMVDVPVYKRALNTLKRVGITE